MKWNRKGQVGVWAFALMLGLTVIIVALALAPAGKQVIESTMQGTVGDTLGLDCAATTSNFVKGACVITDFSMFYFFGGLILIGGSIIVARIIL